MILQTYTLFTESLNKIGSSKMLITTLNAHSYNTLHDDIKFRAALKDSDILLPDGIGVVLAIKFIQ